MKLRTSQIPHPSGAALRTPLLIPSFSSKGFQLKTRGKFKGKSEIWELFYFASEYLTDAMLVSAYDMTYGHLPPANRMRSKTEITFVDSGAFETGPDYDLCAIHRYPNDVKKWTQEQYADFLSRWPRHSPAVFVSFDKKGAGHSVQEQVEQALGLFDRFPHHLHCFLLKPALNRECSLEHTVQGAPTFAKVLAPFHFVGMAEKQLGDRLLAKMVTVAKLRRAMDEAGVTAPIHIFGSLDPLSVCLYMAAGAELFDGLTWLRFGYKKGECVYMSNFGASAVGLDAVDDVVKLRVLSSNHSELMGLQLAMRNAAAANDLRVLKPRIESYFRLILEAVKSLDTRLKGGA